MSDPVPSNDTASCPTTMTWSGLLSCATDNMAALRTHREYTASPLFRAKVDKLAECVDEAILRLQALKCLPAPGEPSFTLLARDPQAPDRVRDWVAARRLANDQSPNAQRKIAEAENIAAKMSEWKREHPSLGLPLSAGTSRTTVESGSHSGSTGLV